MKFWQILQGIPRTITWAIACKTSSVRWKMPLSKLMENIDVKIINHGIINLSYHPVQISIYIY